MPNTSCGTCSGTSMLTAIPFVIRSRITTRTITPQKILVLLLLLGILFLLLAVEAEAGVRERVQAVEVDVLAAAVALAEGLRRAIQPAQRLVDVPQEAPFLAREQECLFALHCVRALVGHVEGIGAQVSIRFRLARAERLAMM